MTDDIYDGATPPINPCGDPLAYGDLWDAFWTDFDAREAGKSHGTQRALVNGELEAQRRRKRRTVFQTQACAEVVDPALGGRCTFVATPLCQRA